MDPVEEPLRLFEVTDIIVEVDDDGVEQAYKIVHVKEHWRKVKVKQ